VCVSLCVWCLYTPWRGLHSKGLVSEGGCVLTVSPSTSRPVIIFLHTPYPPPPTPTPTPNTAPSTTSLANPHPTVSPTATPPPPIRSSPPPPPPSHMQLQLQQATASLSAALERADAAGSKAAAAEAQVTDLQARVSALQASLASTEATLDQCRREKRDLSTQLTAATSAQEHLRREAAAEAQRMHMEAEVGGGVLALNVLGVRSVGCGVWGVGRGRVECEVCSVGCLCMECGGVG
jgi:hypothetical protein